MAATYTPDYSERALSKPKGKTVNDLLIIAEQEFVNRYWPAPNHLNEHAPLKLLVFKHGCLYETFGPEFEFIRSQPRAQIWTLIDEDGELFIASGLRFVNRLGYLYCEEAREPDDCDIIVELDSAIRAQTI
jgi:hypothetical protein